LPFGLLHELVIARDASGTLFYKPHPLIGIIFLIWINDTFAYLGGSLYGKRRMMASVSPGKTWEGTITGVVFSFGSSFLLATQLHDSRSFLWPVLGLIVPVLATVGDLVQSHLKRQADVKDTGRLMPGHGGVLDRFDSLIFVTPFVVVLLKLL
jgi:phosphatidate cytidylyltransferase